MKYSIVYSSRTGNTKLLAETVKAALPCEDCIYFGAPHDEALKADRIYAGFWTDKGSCDGQTAEFLKKVTGQEVYLFGTAGFGGSEDYFKKILESTAENLGEDTHIAGGFMCQGKMPLSVRSRYEKMMEDPEKAPRMKGMIENFDKALSHPDEADLENLRKALL